MALHNILSKHFVINFNIIFLIYTRTYYDIWRVCIWTAVALLLKREVAK